MRKKLIVIVSVVVVLMGLAATGFVGWKWLHARRSLKRIELKLDTNAWPQWRGPFRNGVVPNSPSLIDRVDQEGPPVLWVSEKKIEGDRPGGFGSMVVVDGRLYLLCHRLKEEDGPRVLKKGVTSHWGWISGMPEEFSRMVDEARLSPERAALTDPRERDTWAIQWIKENMKPEWSKFRVAAKNRLLMGDSAPPMEMLEKVAGIEGRQFDSQAELDAWFDANKVDETIRKTVMRQIATKKPYDLMYCLDVTTGKTIWRQDLPSQWLIHPDSATPTVVAGRCYILNSQSKLYCLDATTGEPLWSSKVLDRETNHHNRSSSVLIVDDLAVVSTRKGTMGVDAHSGKVRWRNSKAKGEMCSTVVWEHEGKKYLLVNAANELRCLEPKTGKALWTVPGGIASTPVVAGDCVVICGGSKKVGLRAYRLAVDGATQMWDVSFTDTHASPLVYEGYVYAFGEGYGKEEGGGRGLCVELETGKVCWDEHVGRAQVSTPIMADGKIFVVLFTDLYLIRATSEKYECLGKINLGTMRWTAPALLDGRLFVRTTRGVTCYDVRKEAQKTAVQGTGEPKQGG